MERVITANRILQEIFNVKNDNREDACSLITFNFYIEIDKKIFNYKGHKVEFL